MRNTDENKVMDAAINSAQMALCRGEGKQGAIDAATAIVAAAIEADKALSTATD
jgi:hypothetical protein